MKIQVIKKATPRPAVDAVCVWFLDCATNRSRSSFFALDCAGARSQPGR